MIEIVKHTIRFFLFLIVQVFIFNQLEIGLGIQFMIYPLFIFLLPTEINIILLMAISFALGISIDSFSNTYGLHASASVLIAYGRPYLLKLFEPRDGYPPSTELTISSMGYAWFSSVYGIFLSAHIFWFFLIEQFKWSEFWFLFLKMILSVPLSLGMSIIIQLLFFKKITNR
jgi:hypothetical protein